MYAGEKLEVIAHFCYLGVILQSNNGWNLQEDMLTSKGLKSYFQLKRYPVKFNLSQLKMFSLFDTLIEPLLKNGCEVWAHV